MSDLLVIKSKVYLKPEQMEKWRRIFIDMKKQGTILLPYYFTAEVVPDDVEIKIENGEITE